MESFLFQDWITIRGSGTTPVVQGQTDWLDLERFADAVFWIETAEVTNPGAGSVTLSFETAPSATESFFVAMDSVTGLTGGTLYAPRMVFMNSTGGIPLARLLRWKLVGTAAGTWDVTFRVYITLGPGVRDAFSPMSLSSLVLWLRADQGVLTSGSNVTQWSDLSGNGNHVTQGVGASQPLLVANAIGGRAAIDFSGFNKFLDTTATNLITTAGSSYSVLIVAKNGSGALLTLRRGTVYSSTKFQSTNTYVHGDGINASANVTVPNTSAETASASAAFKSCHRFKGAGVNPDIFLNATQRSISSGGTTGQTTENGLTGFVVGGDASGEMWSGQIAEVIVTANQVSDADRQRIEQYQKNYFGV